MSIKFTISSHINYVEKTKDKIVNSLIDSGVNQEDIYVFIGGSDVSGNYKLLNNNCYHTPHNSMDFTGLISVLELNIEYPFWFLLHDTCYVGNNFYQKILSYNYQNKDCVALTNDGRSMNMGLYSWKYLQEKKEEILLYKNIEYDKEKTNSYKQRLVDNEDVFLNKTYAFNSKLRTRKENISFYTENTKRIIEHYEDINFFKIKANDKVTTEYTLEP